MEAGAAVQEALADELEEAYRSGVWLKERGRLGTHFGLAAARVDLRTPVNEHKVPAQRPALLCLEATAVLCGLMVQAGLQVAPQACKCCTLCCMRGWVLLQGNYAIFVGPQEIYLCRPSTTMSWLGKCARLCSPCLLRSTRMGPTCT